MISYVNIWYYVRKLGRLMTMCAWHYISPISLQLTCHIIFICHSQMPGRQHSGIM
jgi:hypothetical protein